MARLQTKYNVVRQNARFVSRVHIDHRQKFDLEVLAAIVDAILNYFCYIYRPKSFCYDLKLYFSPTKPRDRHQDHQR